MDIGELLTRGIAEIINTDSLKQKLETGKPLRVKYGVDPTRPDIHLGHLVQINRLKELQNLGHTIIFLIGDYTAKIGDPSGRNSTRPVLTEEEIKANAETYFNQVAKILDMEKTEVRYNSEWFSKMSFAEILNLAGKFTVAQIIERDDFEKRLKEGNDIGLHEILYPVMQAYDSVQLKADVEFGGSDQKFNMLAGRDLQKKIGQKPQDVVMMKILIGLDGKAKMSKSLDNYIGLTDKPSDMFGKIMSIPDQLIPDYFELCTNLETKALEVIKQELENGARNPRDIKAQLAKLIVETYHNAETAEEAEQEFTKVYKNKDIPTEIESLKINEGKLKIIDLVVKIDSAVSRSEARRLVEQGGVVVSGNKITNPDEEIKIENDLVVKIGKHKFARIEK